MGQWGKGKFIKFSEVQFLAFAFLFLLAVASSRATWQAARKNCTNLQLQPSIHTWRCRMWNKNCSGGEFEDRFQKYPSYKKTYSKIIISIYLLFFTINLDFKTIWQIFSCTTYKLEWLIIAALWQTSYVNLHYPSISTITFLRLGKWNIPQHLTVHAK